MGQGEHVRIVFGTLDVPEFDEEGDPWDNPPPGLSWRDMPKRRYESRQNWCGYTVAANNGVADPPALDLERFAVPIEDLAAYVERAAPEALREARRKWAAWRARYPAFGEGRLLFVAEYD